MTPLTSASLSGPKKQAASVLKLSSGENCSDPPSDTESFSRIPHESELFLNLHESRREFCHGVCSMLTKEETSVEVHDERDECFHGRKDDGEKLHATLLV